MAACMLCKDDKEPEFSDTSYFTMLFSAGIAIGLFYYGMAETIYHYKPGNYGNRYWGSYIIETTEKFYLYSV